VTRPGGRILVTVPFGRREDHGWFRQLDADDLDRLVAASGAPSPAVTLFAYGRGGWRRATAAEADDLAYRDADSASAEDGAVAARAVACVAIDV
jgi:hypothetical protein